MAELASLPIRWRTSQSLISRDIVDVLDAEKLEKVICFGQRWGCKAISRPANYYHERTIGCVFPTTSFTQVLPPMDFQVFLDSRARDVRLVEISRSTRSSASCLRNPGIWKKHLALTGTLEQSLLDDFVSFWPAYLSEEDAKHFVETFRCGGFCSDDVL
ncbi:uncharacterized protein PHACADRAFT_201691 [Phanerochaete carnosa HHB-10118-sp]|uniref:Uncharacterized protein n=1 Tax=Phanerochaete carnosa (strain HHB-10118-sp) TaxID=650164 RepID=K5UIT1_PHACS|nr:uncharacterized protein PHACADRAFT_201691 [Phanerochaete carnosa HHB-10118-sp]EKM49431.1 hypothetical protein PHACADRAFT_201691 [Phanerochaete carnosa HHB-10118-sp]